MTTAASTVRLRSVAPQFAVADLIRTTVYYRDVLGFALNGYWDGQQVTEAPNPASPPVFAIVSRDDVQIFFGLAAAADAPRPPRTDDGYDLFVHVDGVDALAEQLRASGADIVDGPEDRPYGQRELIVRDCNGLVFAFGQRIPRA
jgi:lactoylglutathione lyase